jgi:uncharacterized protein (TIGR03382 family)
MQPAEPLEAGALMRSMLWDRIKENSTPVAFVVGLLIALLLFRRRR